MIQQVLLESVSNFFTKALRNEHLGDKNEEGVLRFPEDRVDAWEVLVYWIFCRQLPAPLSDAYAPGGVTRYRNQLLIVHCWALGDRYSIVEFHDDSLLVLVLHCVRRGLSWEAIKVGIKASTPGTPIRTRLFAFEAEAFIYKRWESEMDEQDYRPNYHQMDELDGQHFVSEIMAAHDEQPRKARCIPCVRGLFTRENGDPEPLLRSLFLGKRIEERTQFEYVLFMIKVAEELGSRISSSYKRIRGKDRCYQPNVTAKASKITSQILG